ncbi:MAG: glycosyltransferase, partial [Clostridia bacterium]|nr:glycosyltransferase [Clostridia bacterium]
METALFVFSIILQAFVLSLGTYYFIVSLFGWMPKANDKLPEELHYHKFALVTSAHNEAAVIANLVDSLAQQNYPRECYDIFIIADNCTDNTAEIAREHGAIVYERFNDT